MNAELDKIVHDTFLCYTKRIFRNSRPQANSKTHLPIERKMPTTSGRTWIAPLWKDITRGLHFKENPRKYPKVNIKDIVLDKPRYGFRRERPPLMSQSVRDTLFPNTAIKENYVEAGKPIPIKFNAGSDEIGRRNYERYKDELAFGEPHFKIGNKKVYFPKARICLLRPNAKHTPYQAKFLVPRNFNKMDLRDYLWHVYGLRALNVTVQLLHAKFTKGADDHARYRGPQYKKMTIDMEEPFIWPDLPRSLVERSDKMFEGQIKAMEMKNASGSDKLKPNEAFGGLYNKPELPHNFVPRRLRSLGEENLKLQRSRDESRRDRKLVAELVGL